MSFRLDYSDNNPYPLSWQEKYLRIILATRSRLQFQGEIHCRLSEDSACNGWFDVFSVPCWSDYTDVDVALLLNSSYPKSYGFVVQLLTDGDYAANFVTAGTATNSFGAE